MNELIKEEKILNNQLLENIFEFDFEYMSHDEYMDIFLSE